MLFALCFQKSIKRNESFGSAEDGTETTQKAPTHFAALARRRLRYARLGTGLDWMQLCDL